jgi:uncharacterized OsmC-like protein
MADERTHRVSVRLTRGYEFEADFTDLPEAPTLQFDEPAPLGHNRAPNAAAVLAAAVGNCLAASFAFCLRKARIEPTQLSANVTTHIVRNEQGRHRIGSIDVEIVPEFSDVAATRTERCEALFEDFCTVTASVRRGIPVHVTLKRPEELSHANDESGRIQREGSPGA